MSGNLSQMRVAALECDSKQNMVGGFLSASLFICYSPERQRLLSVIQAADADQEKIRQLLKSPLSICVI